MESNQNYHSNQIKQHRLVIVIIENGLIRVAAVIIAKLDQLAIKHGTIQIINII